MVTGENTVHLKDATATALDLNGQVQRKLANITSSQFGDYVTETRCVHLNGATVLLWQCHGGC